MSNNDLRDLFSNELWNHMEAFKKGLATASGLVVLLAIDLEEEIARAKRYGPEGVRRGDFSQAFLDAEIAAMEKLASAIATYRVELDAAMSHRRNHSSPAISLADIPDSEKSPDQKWYASNPFNPKHD